MYNILLTIINKHLYRRSFFARRQQRGAGQCPLLFVDAFRFPLLDVPRGAAHAVALSVQAHRFLKVGQALGRRRTSQFLWGILLTFGRFQALSPISESEAIWGHRAAVF